MSERQLRADGALVHPTAEVRAAQLGAWTEVGARTSVAESTLGDYSYVMNDADLVYTDTGRFCSIAAHTRLNPGNHPLDRAALHHFTYRSALYGLGDDDQSFFEARRQCRVTLGHDVWIGHGAVVQAGVTIGTGAAVGSGAVVTRDVAPFTVVAGVPARPLRCRFDEETIAGLLELAWWSWDHERLRAALPDLRRLGAAEFLRRYAGR